MQTSHRSPSLAHQWIVSIALCCLTSVAAPCLGQEPSVDNPDQPLSIVTSPSVDENLFALRLLRNTYSHWPNLGEDHEQLRQWFANARASSSSMRGVIHARGLDPELEILFTDSIEYMSATESYLSALEAIQRQKDNQTAWDLISSGWDGYTTSNDVREKASKVTSQENAANVGQFVGTADAVVGFLSKSQKNEQNAKIAIAEQGRRLEDRWTTADATLRQVAQRLTKRHGWTVGEAGFDGFQSPQLADLIDRSPHDPFLRAQYGDSLLENAKTPNDCVPAINAYLLAASLVPADSAYDVFRLEFVQSATVASLSASGLETGSYSGHPASAYSAVKLSRTYLSLDPTDSSGIGHVDLARALGFAGRYAEAVKSAQNAYNSDKNWANDPGFCIRYSKLMSLTGDQNMSVAWFDMALRKGLLDVAALRTDPDFELLKQTRNSDFKRLTTAVWSWGVKYGVTLDDVVVHNRSPFSLTNVKVTVHIRKGSQVWDKAFTCKEIKSDSECQGDNLFSIPNDSYDEGTASLTSDQD